MDDLISTVGQRYKRGIGLHGIATLSHRIRPGALNSAGQQQNIKAESFFNRMGGHLASLSRKLREELIDLVTRGTSSRDKALKQSVSREMLLHVQQWKKSLSQAESTRLQVNRRMDKRAELFIADTGAKIGRIRRDIQLMQQREEKRREKDMRLPPEDLPLSHRGAKRLLEERIELTQTEIQAQIKDSAKRNIKNAIKVAREERMYEMRRGGDPGWKTQRL